jgi:polysaccharide pyruvyl transferase WcaK-like protein
MGKRDYILSILLTIYTALIRLGQSIVPRRSSEVINSSVLVLPAASVRGNLGDDALVAATVDYLQQKGVKQISLIGYTSNQWEDFSSISETLEMENYFSSGSLIESLKALMHFSKLISQYEQFYFLGADVVDGHYSESLTNKRLQIVSLAAQMGLKSSILGCSFNEKPSIGSVKALQNLPQSVKINARDPISKERLEEHLNRPIELVADVAFLLRPTDTSSSVVEITEWISQQRSENRIVVGVSPYCRFGKHLEVNTLESITQIYLDTLVELYSINKSLSFLLIPHDYRSNSRTGKFSDPALNQKIFEKLPSEVKAYCKQVSTPWSAADVKGIVGQLDMVLSGKMHLAIACLDEGTPVGCITYQDKFKGLFRHFELDEEELTIVPEQACQSSKLVEFMNTIIVNRKEIRNKITKKIPQVQQLARRNFLA